MLMHSRTPPPSSARSFRGPFRARTCSTDMKGLSVPGLPIAPGPAGPGRRCTLAAPSCRHLLLPRPLGPWLRPSGMHRARADSPGCSRLHSEHRRPLPGFFASGPETSSRLRWLPGSASPGSPWRWHCAAGPPSPGDDRHAPRPPARTSLRRVRAGSRLAPALRPPDCSPRRPGPRESRRHPGAGLRRRGIHRPHRASVAAGELHLLGGSGRGEHLGELRRVHRGTPCLELGSRVLGPPLGVGGGSASLAHGNALVGRPELMVVLMRRGEPFYPGQERTLQHLR